MRLMTIFTLMLALNISVIAQGDMAAITPSHAYFTLTPLDVTLYTESKVAVNGDEFSNDQPDVEEEVPLKEADLKIYANNGPGTFTIDNLPKSTNIKVFSTTGKTVDFSRIDNTFHLMTRGGDNYVLVLEDPVGQFSIRRLLVL